MLFFFCDVLQQNPNNKLGKKQGLNGCMYPSGDHDPHCLTLDGYMRTGAITNLFAPRGQLQLLQSSLVSTPTKLLAALDKEKPDGDGSKRPQVTITQLGERLGLDVVANYGCCEWQRVISEAMLFDRDEACLICWPWYFIPFIAYSLPVSNPRDIPQTWRRYPDAKQDPKGVGVFDMIWVFDLDEDTGLYKFTQVPQYLLPSDTGPLPFPTQISIDTTYPPVGCCKSWNLLLPPSYVKEDGAKEVGEVDDAKK